MAGSTSSWGKSLLERMFVCPTVEGSRRVVATVGDRIGVQVALPHGWVDAATSNWLHHACRCRALQIRMPQALDAVLICFTCGVRGTKQVDLALNVIAFESNTVWST